MHSKNFPHRSTGPDDASRRQWLRRAVSMTGGLTFLSGCGGTPGAEPQATGVLPTDSSASTAGASGSSAGVVAQGGASSPSTGTSTSTSTSAANTATASPQSVATNLPPAEPPPAVAQSAPRPAWADTVPLNTWHTLPGTAFLPWAKANMPPGAYRGTAPFESIVNAYSEAAHQPGASAQYFYGGGHGDGTCNAVCRFDHQTLQWSLVGQPTPPSVYLPGYLSAAGPLTYPSGTPAGNWFLTAAELPDPADAPYRAPALARVSTHMYAAAAMRGDTVHYFYLTYGEFNTRTGTWAGLGVDLGQQLLKFRPQYGSFPLQQGTVALYDDVTDRIFVTLTPGDNGGGWRTGLMVFNATTRQIESIHEVSGDLGFMHESVNICKVGRKLYVFQKAGSYGQPTTMNGGLIADMDQMASARSGSLQMLAATKFVLTGDTAGSTYPFASNQESIPSWYDGQAIRRWNYAPAHVGTILSVHLAPIGGSGTPSDPWRLTQTASVPAGQVPTNAVHIYSRFVFHSGARCALVIPHAGSDWVAMRFA